MRTERLPLVAVVGRPNVGKSSFVNRVSGRADAIVHSARGVTRDRSYHEAEWNGRTFLLVDTGGVELSRDDAFQSGIRAQAEIATQQADEVVFLVDGQTGLTADDEELARLLKRARKPLFLVVNKVDTPGSEQETYEFWNLGLGTPYPVSATHGNGTGDLLDEMVAALPVAGADDADSASDEPAAIRIALIGRPNAGKSSLVNRLARAERSLVSEIAGTTRDAVDTTVTCDGRSYTLVDTAGIRRKALIDSDVEYYGFVRAMRAIDASDVALLILDAQVGLTDQDQRIASYAVERGRGIVVLLNKWDLLTGKADAPDTLPSAADAAATDDTAATDATPITDAFAETAADREQARIALLDRVTDRLNFISWAPVLRVSALTGRNTARIFAAVDTAYQHYTGHIATSALNRFLTELRQFGHTVSRGPQRLTLSYVTQTHDAPPAFTFFCNNPALVDDAYRRYLENRLREHFDLTGTPVTLRFRKKDA